MKNLTYLLITCFCLFFQLASAQEPMEARSFIARAANFQERYAPEKVYLHIDKSSYFMGDTLWFKAYVFDALNVSAATKSQRLYVELLDDSLSHSKRIAIPIVYGIGWGQIPLSAKQLREGNYTIRAYTNWMQNLDEGRFFKQRLYIGQPSDGRWKIRSEGSLVKNDKGEEKLRIQLQITDLKQQPVAGRQIQVSIRNADRSLLRLKRLSSSTGNIDVLLDVKDKWRSRDLQIALTDLQNKNKQIPVSVPLIFNRPEAIDLQFFPEGGKLVEGITGKVAFKALNEDGRGAMVSGAVYDSQNNKVAQFTSFDKGMGVFSFRPVNGEKYTARVENPLGSTQIYKLPEVEQEGTVLNIVNEVNKDSLVILPKYSGRAAAMDVYHLIGESRGFVCYAAIIHPEDSLIKISKSIFPAGIAHISLFKDSLLLNERLVFIDRDENLRVHIQPETLPPYAGDSITMSLEVKDSNGRPAKNGSFSLAVTDDGLVRADKAGNNGINYWLLLRSDLKGYLEEPSWYFNKNNPDRWPALDALLLTQGWAGMDWGKVFDTAPPKFIPEQGLEVTGRVVSAFKKPVEGAQILLTSHKPDFIRETLADKDGRFRFDSLPLLDTPSLFVVANKADGKSLNTGQLLVDKFIPPDIPTEILPGVLPWYATTDSIMNKRVNAALAHYKKDDLNLKGNVLNEVVIKGKKIIPNSDNPNGSGNADIVLDAKDIKAASTSNLYDLLRTTLPGFKVVKKEGYASVMIDNYFLHLIMDGIDLRLNISSRTPTVQEVIQALKDMPISAYVGIEVLYSYNYTNTRFKPQTSKPFNPEGAQQRVLIMSRETFGRGYDREEYDDRYTLWLTKLFALHNRDIGYIHITTRLKTGNYDLGNSRLTHTLYNPVGTIAPKQFYNPQYKMNEDGSAPLPLPTVYWKPNIVTDEEGKAKITFYPFSRPWNYSIIIQGADLKGGVGSASVKLTDNSLSTK